MLFSDPTITFSAALAAPSFKLSADENGITDLSLTKTDNASLSLTAGRNDDAAFSLLVSADCAFALSTDTAPWFSQNLSYPTVRVSADAPFPVTVSHTDMHRINDGTYRADAILHSAVKEIPADTVSQLFCTMHIPRDAAPGRYSVTLRFFFNSAFADETLLGTLTLPLTIAAYTFPDNAHNGFHLDLWQHLSNIARKHEVPLWSDAHFAVLEHYCKSLGELGVKSVTVVASEIPWAGQSCHNASMPANLYEYSMIGVTKKADGSLVCDYTVMQRYIDLCAKYGIDECISVFGLANVWNAPERCAEKTAPDYPDWIHIRCFDEASGTYRYLKDGADIDAYIRALERYFVETDQIGRVRIAADEPHDLEPFRESLARLHKNAPRFRCKTACNKPEFVEAFSYLMDDFIFDIDTVAGRFDEMQAIMRAHTDKRFLYYVCCGPAYPNNFLASDLTESYFQGIYASYAHVSGFLRWDYTVWNDDPRKNAIVNTWNAGDGHFVYPSADGSPLLSLRWHALRRGIRFFVLLEDVRKRGMTDVYSRAVDMVLREPDPTKLISHPEKTDSISCSSDDYENVWAYLLSALCDA